MSSVSVALAERLEAVQERMDRAATRSGRSRQAITLVAVTKTISLENILPVLHAGVGHVGENRVQEAFSKYGDLQGKKRAEFANIQLHLIGPLQSNKVKKAVGFFDGIQTLDRVKLGDELNRYGEQLGRVISCLVQVKISPEISKSGLTMEKVASFLEQSSRWSFLKIRGLMGIAPYMENPEEARPYFAQLRRLFENARLDILSMGMSHDFEAAIVEGATMIRVGTAIFGERVKQ